MVSENAQELLEKLWIAEEDGQDGLACPDQLIESMHELAQTGLVEGIERVWKLTPSGRVEASQAIRRHRLGERLLADVIKTDDTLLDEQACRLEHVLYDGLDDSVCTLLGHPQYCPHGKPIPQGECCRQMRATVGRLIAPLGDLEPGQAGQVAYIQMSSAELLHKVIAMGILPGGKIKLLRSSPSFVFEYGFSQFAVDENIAGEIFVRLNHA